VLSCCSFDQHRIGRLDDVVWLYTAYTVGTIGLLHRAVLCPMWPNSGSAQRSASWSRPAVQAANSRGVPDVRETVEWYESIGFAVINTNEENRVSIQVFGATDAQQADVEAIVQRVAELQHAQQNELPEAFMRLFRTTDPVWTTGHGRRLSGWDEINEFTHSTGLTVAGIFWR
jgi:hypothetical protein